MESTVMITVWAGSSPPPPVESIHVPELAYLRVFSSRSSEDGRDRYRLHVGYFANSKAAKRVLPQVRELYPSAWVVPAARHRPLARLEPHALLASPPYELKPFARQDLSAELTGEIGLDMAALIALLEEGSVPPPPANADLLVDHSVATIPDAVAPAPAPPQGFDDAFHALSRLIVEEWRADAPVVRASAASRSWLTRLPRLIR